MVTYNIISPKLDELKLDIARLNENNLLYYTFKINF